MHAHLNACALMLAYASIPARIICTNAIESRYNWRCMQRAARPSCPIRAASAHLSALATECAHAGAGNYIDTRLRAAVRALATLAGVPVLSGIPYAPIKTPICEAKARAAIAAHAFASAPSVNTFLMIDRALARLSLAFVSASDLSKAKLLSQTAPACEPFPFVPKRANADDIHALHAGSANVARFGNSNCPPTWETAALSARSRDRAAKRKLAEHIRRSPSVRAAIFLLSSMD